MNNLRETCHCGHDKASHYRDESVRPAVLRACLCTGCDCGAYADANGPAPKKWLEQNPVPPAADTLRGIGDEDFDP